MPLVSASTSAGGGPLPDPAQILHSPTLRVDPGAIPRLRRVFSEALAKLDRQIELAISEIRVRPWAGDPVSADAADQFNEHAADSLDSALASLQGYQRQLKAALDALAQVEEQYHAVEGDNTAVLDRQGGC